MKIRFFGVFTVVLFLFSCAGRPSLDDNVPEWVTVPAKDTETHYAFNAKGYGRNLDSARRNSLYSLTDMVLDKMGLSGIKPEDASGIKALNEFKNQLGQLVEAEGYSGLEGAYLEHGAGWLIPEEGVAYGLTVLWERKAFERKAEELSALLTMASPEFKDFKKRAGDAESKGDIYGAALLWGAAAETAYGNNYTAGVKEALKNIEALLKRLDYRVVSVPEKAYQDFRPEEPVIFKVLYKDAPVPNAEFAVSYPDRSRDGSKIISTARFLTDKDGLLYFRPPEIAFEGVQLVTLAPSAKPFVKSLDNSDYIKSFVQRVETPVSETSFEAISPLRKIPMGILVLETDLAGNPLNSSDAAMGLLDLLASDGFNVEIVELDAQDVIDRTDKELLRDLKADKRFSEKFGRVLLGRVILESFEQNGSNYTVKVSGTLSVSDIARQVTLYSSEISKSSRASGSDQAMSSAFRQLGRSFAEELISQAP